MANAVIQGNIPQDAPKVYVNFSAEIVPVTTEALLTVMTECANKNVKGVCLMMSGPGGSVQNGLHLYNMLRAMPFDLTTHNTGSVNSIANVVFLAGEKRYAVTEATFMFHGVGFDVQRNDRFEEARLRERLDGILNDQKRIGAIIDRHSNLNTKQIAGLFRRAQTKDAAFALNCGLIDEIKPANIPAGSPVVSLIFQR